MVERVLGGSFVVIGFILNQLLFGGPKALLIGSAGGPKLLVLLARGTPLLARLSLGIGLVGPVEVIEEIAAKVYRLLTSISATFLAQILILVAQIAAPLRAFLRAGRLRRRHDAFGARLRSIVFRIHLLDRFVVVH